MAAGLAALVLAYVLSQFFRAFLAVLAPALGADLGATPEDLAFASGLWFAAFAAMQIPIGLGLDRFGPRRTSGLLFGFGAAGGAALFATAGSPAALIAAMALIGAGCGPVLISSLYIFARTFPPAMFATLGAGLIGVGSAGNLASAAPLAWVADALGWRGALWGLAALSLAVGAAMLVFIRDPARAPAPPAGGGGFGAILRQPALWLLVPMIAINYAPAAGVRGLWAGPYLGEVFGRDAAGIGAVTLWMAVAMILGNFAYGPLDRLLGTRKWVVLGGNLLAAACLLALAAWPARSVPFAGAMLAGLGFFGASYAMVFAHAKAWFPPHLTGRGVSVVNLISIGGVALLQVATGRVYAAVAAEGGPPEAPFRAIFLCVGLLAVAGCASYAFTRDRMD